MKGCHYAKRVQVFSFAISRQIKYNVLISWLYWKQIAGNQLHKTAVCGAYSSAQSAIRSLSFMKAIEDVLDKMVSQLLIGQALYR